MNESILEILKKNGYGNTSHKDNDSKKLKRSGILVYHVSISS